MRIYSIFRSIDGEVNHFHQGRMTTFIRFAGCNMLCNYCDTKYALDRSSGKEMTVKQILSQVKKFGTDKVTITGGEPLMQRRGFDVLVRELRNCGWKISVETNGSYPIPWNSWVNSWIVDYKLPSSGMEHLMNPKAFESLGRVDFVKFVIGNKEDFDRALVIREQLKPSGVQFAFSPVYGIVETDALINWLIGKEVMDAIVNVQLHKLITGFKEQQ